MNSMFHHAKDKLRMAQSTLSKRSLARNPLNHTKRLIKTYEALWSLNQLQDYVADIAELDRQVEATHQKLTTALAAIANGDLPSATNAVNECVALIAQAETQSELVEGSLREIRTTGPTLTEVDNE